MPRQRKTPNQPSAPYIPRNPADEITDEQLFTLINQGDNTDPSFLFDTFFKKKGLIEPMIERIMALSIYSTEDNKSELFAFNRRLLLTNLAREISEQNPIPKGLPPFFYKVLQALKKYPVIDDWRDLLGNDLPQKHPEMKAVVYQIFLADDILNDKITVQDAIAEIKENVQLAGVQPSFSDIEKYQSWYNREGKHCKIERPLRLAVLGELITGLTQKSLSQEDYVCIFKESINYQSYYPSEIAKESQKDNAPVSQLFDKLLKEPNPELKNAVLTSLLDDPSIPNAYKSNMICTLLRYNDLTTVSETVREKLLLRGILHSHFFSDAARVNHPKLYDDSTLIQQFYSLLRMAIEANSTFNDHLFEDNISIEKSISVGFKGTLNTLLSVQQILPFNAMLPFIRQPYFSEEEIVDLLQKKTDPRDDVLPTVYRLLTYGRTDVDTKSLLGRINELSLDASKKSLYCRAMLEIIKEEPYLAMHDMCRLNNNISLEGKNLSIKAIPSDALPFATDVFSLAMGLMDENEKLAFFNGSLLVGENLHMKGLNILKHQPPLMREALSHILTMSAHGQTLMIKQGLTEEMLSKTIEMDPTAKRDLYLIELGAMRDRLQSCGRKNAAKAAERLFNDLTGYLQQADQTFLTTQWNDRMTLAKGDPYLNQDLQLKNIVANLTLIGLTGGLALVYLVGRKLTEATDKPKPFLFQFFGDKEKLDKTIEDLSHGPDGPEKK